MSPSDSRACPPGKAFTLIEMMVSMTVLSVLMVLLFVVVNNLSSLWARSAGKMQSFQAARAAFESLTRNLSQATLQSYYGYADNAGNPVPLINPSFKPAAGDPPVDRTRIPSRYMRMSELHFLTGTAAGILQTANTAGLQTSGHAMFFQAPAGYSDTAIYRNSPGLLNNFGYFVQYVRDDDDAGRGTDAIPGFTSTLASSPKPTSRYRLMEVIQPTEKNSIYRSTNVVGSNGLPNLTYDLSWITDLALAQRSNRHVLADNVLLLYFLPKLAPEDETLHGGTGDGSLIAPRYTYDSRSWEQGYSGEGITRTTNATLVDNVIMNRLPPLVEVVMVAIDDASAQRLAERYSGGSQSPPLDDPSVRETLNLEQGFVDAAVLRGSNNDLEKLKEGLDKLSINHTIFHTEVRLPAASYGE